MTIVKIMRVQALLILIWLIVLSITVSAQLITKPILLGKWNGGEDYLEFLSNQSLLMDAYLKDYPDGKIVIRLCSKSGLPTALVRSNGAPYQIKSQNTFQFYSEKIFFTTFSKCTSGFEQYWFLPPGVSIAYDEIILANNVDSWRWVESYHPNPTSSDAVKEFRDNLEEFIERLRLETHAQGFVIQNLRTDKKQVDRTYRQITRAGLNIDRVKLIKKKEYQSYYPELMVLTVAP